MFKAVHSISDFTYIDVKLDTSLQVFIDHDMNSGLSYVQSVSTSFCINLRPLKDPCPDFSVTIKTQDGYTMTK